MGDAADQVAKILWGKRLIDFYLFTGCAHVCAGWTRALQRCLGVGRWTAHWEESWKCLTPLHLKKWWIVLISSHFYGRWKRIRVGVYLLMISWFAVNVRAGGRGWDRVPKSQQHALFSDGLQKTVLQTSLAHCCFSKSCHAVLMVSEQSLWPDTFSPWCGLRCSGMWRECNYMVLNRKRGDSD